MAETTTSLDSADILRVMQLLPHRYPFLLVDRIVDMNAGDSCIGIKNVTINEPHFMGHFPGMPVMPGVLILEGMAQTAGALALNHQMGDLDEAPLVYLMTIDKARFRRPVVPGDQLRYIITKIRTRQYVIKYGCVAEVDGARVAEAEVTATISPRSVPADDGGE
ncbi:MAG: 3-hydroxyacyl-ACP dehydratase FabZ [Flavobacteriaceae bacterium]